MFVFYDCVYKRVIVCRPHIINIQDKGSYIKKKKHIHIKILFSIQNLKITFINT